MTGLPLLSSAPDDASLTHTCTAKTQPEADEFARTGARAVRTHPDSLQNPWQVANEAAASSERARAEQRAWEAASAAGAAASLAAAERAAADAQQAACAALQARSRHANPRY